MPAGFPYFAARKFRTSLVRLEPEPSSISYTSLNTEGLEAAGIVGYGARHANCGWVLGFFSHLSLCSRPFRLGRKILALEISDTGTKP